MLGLCDTVDSLLSYRGGGVLVRLHSELSGPISIELRCPQAFNVIDLMQVSVRVVLGQTI